MKMQEKKEDKLHKIKKEPTNIGKPTFTSSKIGAGDRTRFTFSSAKKIAVLFPSSREQATVHQGVAFRWDQVFVQHKEDVSRTKHEI